MGTRFRIIDSRWLWSCIGLVHGKVRAFDFFMKLSTDPTFSKDYGGTEWNPPESEEDSELPESIDLLAEPIC